MAILECPNNFATASNGTPCMTGKSMEQIMHAHIRQTGAAAKHHPKLNIEKRHVVCTGASGFRFYR
jgi:hypothetical protein